MITFTKEKFEQEFKIKVKDKFDLMMHLTAERKIELMNNPKVALIYNDYGSIQQGAVVILAFMLQGTWWMEDGRVRAIINEVTIFNDFAEMESHKSEASKSAKSPLSLN